jgi:hypothetical protein
MITELDHLQRCRRRRGLLQVTRRHWSATRWHDYERIARETDSDPDEAAWRTAVDAAPYLLDEQEAAGQITPEKAFEKLKRFKDLVADDIRSGPGDPPDDR